MRKRTRNTIQNVTIVTRNEDGNLKQVHENGFTTIHKGGLVQKTSLNMDLKCKTNKANKEIRTRLNIENQINGISKRVEISKMTNKQRRKYYAQLNK
jgi:hypothetical protein